MIRIIQFIYLIGFIFLGIYLLADASTVIVIRRASTTTTAVLTEGDGWSYGKNINIDDENRWSYGKNIY